MRATIPERAARVLGEGWTLEQTGGGCMAFRLAMPDGGEVLVCDDETGVDGDPQALIWYADRYDSEGNGLTAPPDVGTLAECVAWARRQGGASGEPG